MIIILIAAGILLAFLVIVFWRIIWRLAVVAVVVCVIAVGTFLANIPMGTIS